MSCWAIIFLSPTTKDVLLIFPILFLLYFLVKKLGQAVNNLHGMQGSGVSDLSNDSSPTHGYPDFPPSPDSWLGEAVARTNQTNSTPAVDY